MERRQIIVGSRESALAQIQANTIIHLLQDADSKLGQEVILRTFKTQGDILLEKKLSEIGEKGLFVKELETALLAGEIDIAVHSMKDMPGEIPDGLALQSAGLREDARDVLIGRNAICSLETLAPGSIIGTSSVRRIAQLKRLQPDLEYRNIRGNLQTRLKKLDDGLYDALVLAAAGCHRAGYNHRISQYFDPIRENIPAVCQGILAVEFRANDEAIRHLLDRIMNPETEMMMKAEREVLRQLQAGCSIPLGVYAHPEILERNEHPEPNSLNRRYHINAILFSTSDSRFKEAEGSFIHEWEIPEIGREIANRLRFEWA